MDASRLLDRWRTRASRVQTAHYETAALLSRRHFWVGIPLVILAGLVGTSVFATLQENTSVAVRMAVGAASVIAAVLASVQTFLRHEERAEKHRIAGVRYGALKRRIEHHLAFPPSEVNDVERLVDGIRTDWDALNEECPSIPMGVWNRVARSTSSELPAGIPLGTDQVRALSGVPLQRSRQAGS
jgi:hypothetical protein